MMVMVSVYVLDLVDDPVLIAEYEAHHRAVWPEVQAHLRDSGIRACEIFRVGNRLVMHVTADQPVATDGGGGPVPPRVAEWEALMDRYQRRLPFAAPGQKWVLAPPIFRWTADPG